MGVVGLRTSQSFLGLVSLAAMSAFHIPSFLVQKVCEVRRLRSPVSSYDTKIKSFLYFRIFKMILRISKCAQSIPGIISDRPRWSRIMFENYFKSENLSEEVE